MHGIIRASSDGAKAKDRELVSEAEKVFPYFGPVARTLWPIKTNLSLVHLLEKEMGGVDERTIRNWLAGRHEPATCAWRVVWNKLTSPVWIG